MADDYFDLAPAISPGGGTVPGAVAKVYAIEDEAFLNPLEITDLSGVPMDELVASADGIYPAFRVVSGEKRVMAKSGDLVLPMTSSEGLRGPAGPAGPAGAGTDPTGSVAGQVLTSTGPDTTPEYRDPPNGSGIQGAPSTWPSTFTPAAHTHPTSNLRTGADAPLSAPVLNLLSAASQAAARAAIGAGTGNGSSNLTLGTTSTTAARGDHGHTADALAFESTPAIPATDVQSAIEFVAASGGGGGTVDTVPSLVRVETAPGVYPPRGTARADLQIVWMGSVPPPSATPTSGTNFVTSAVALSRGAGMGPDQWQGIG